MLQKRGKHAGDAARRRLVNIYRTLIFVSATIILTVESVWGDFYDESDVDEQQYWRGPYDRFRSGRPHHFGPYKHHGPNFFGPHKPWSHESWTHGPWSQEPGPHEPWTHGPGSWKFHPPHHDYHHDHRHYSCWFRGGPHHGWDWGPHKHPRPPSMKPSSEIPPSEAPTFETPSETPPSEAPATETSSSEVNPPEESPSEESPSEESPPSEAPISPETKEPTVECTLECLLTTNADDDNTVCGSNGVTYRNAKTLECFRECGVDVSLDYHGKCEKDKDSSVIKEPAPVVEEPAPVVEEPAPVKPAPQLDSMLLCMISYPVTPEYNPVCGSDGMTYVNPGRIECAKMCGRNVEIVQDSRCPSNDIMPDSNTNIIPTPTSPPITNGTPKNASPGEDSPVVPSEGPPNTDAESSSKSLPLPEDFTVPQDVLDEIFSFSTEYSELIDVRRDRSLLDK